MEVSLGMKKIVLGLAALAEAGTGLLLLVSPSLVVSLLFGVESGGVAVVMSRIAGIALLGLGVACWPGDSPAQPLYGMLTYSVLAMVYLVRIGIRGVPVGLLLWPGVAVHAILVVLLIGARFKKEKTRPA
jgi:hypothetical protein